MEHSGHSAPWACYALPVYKPAFSIASHCTLKPFQELNRFLRVCFDLNAWPTSGFDLRLERFEVSFKKFKATEAPGAQRKDSFELQLESAKTGYTLGIYPIFLPLELDLDSRETMGVSGCRCLCVLRLDHSLCRYGLFT